MKSGFIHQRPYVAAIAACYFIIWIIAAIQPVDRKDWLLENILIFAGIPVLIFSLRRFTLSNFACTMIFIFLILHATGSHYTYSRVPLGYWMQEWFHFERNHFDRVVHFLFGALLPYPLFEIYKQRKPLRYLWGAWSTWLITAAMSGLFEIIEGLVAKIVSPELGSAYLGTQGDPWDAQMDMGLAMAGAGISILLLVAFDQSKKPRPTI